MFLLARQRNGYLYGFGYKRAIQTMLLYERRKVVAVNWFDEIVRSTQINAHRLVVHNRYHNHWDFCQLRIGFELVEYRPTVTVRHYNIQRDDHRMNLPGKTESFFATPGSNDIEIHLGKETRHKIPNCRVVIYY